jgi:hypothetical protein
VSNKQPEITASGRQVQSRMAHRMGEASCGSLYVNQGTLRGWALISGHSAVKELVVAKASR